MIRNIENGGPAFPYQHDQDNKPREQAWGMSMRDYFAAAALHGLCANNAVIAENGMSGWKLVNCTEDDLTGYAYHLADAMLNHRHSAAESGDEK